jgi:hypothetical protein
MHDRDDSGICPSIIHYSFFIIQYSLSFLKLFGFCFVPLTQDFVPTAVCPPPRKRRGVDFNLGFAVYFTLCAFNAGFGETFVGTRAKRKTHKAKEKITGSP